VSKKLPKYWTTVTPLSRTITAILFAALPLIGFLYGVKYQERADQKIVEACVR